MMYVKADDESILSYGEEVQRQHTAFMPLDLSTVVSEIGINKQSPPPSAKGIVQGVQRHFASGIISFDVFCKSGELLCLYILSYKSCYDVCTLLAEVCAVCRA